MIDPRLVLLFGGCVLFGGLIAAQFAGGSDETGIAVVRAADRAGESRAAPSRPAPPLDELVSASLARPLFSPDRRPSVSPQSTAADGKRLAGIVIEPDRRLAIFAAAGGKPLTVGEGDSVDGWRIESITESEVSLVGAQGSRRLQPKPDPAFAVEARGLPAKPARRAPVQAGQPAPAQSPQPAAKLSRGAPKPASPSDRDTRQRIPPGRNAGLRPLREAAPLGAPAPPSEKRDGHAGPTTTSTASQRQ